MGHLFHRCTCKDCHVDIEGKLAAEQGGLECSTVTPNELLSPSFSSHNDDICRHLQASDRAADPYESNRKRAHLLAAGKDGIQGQRLHFKPELKSSDAGLEAVVAQT